MCESYHSCSRGSGGARNAFQCCSLLRGGDVITAPLLVDVLAILEKEKLVVCNVLFDPLKMQ